MSKQRHPIHEKLKAIPLFNDFTDSELEEFLDLADPTIYNPGELIVRQGEEGRSMFYVVEGKLWVVQRKNGDFIELATLGPGEIFGELSLWDHMPRSADVQALSECTLLKVSDATLNALAGVFPRAAFKFLQGIVRVIGERLRKTSKRYVDSLLATPIPAEDEAEEK